MRIAFAVLAVVGLGGAVALATRGRHCCDCAHGGAARPATPEAVLTAALRARSEGDLAALLSLCSDAGRRGIEADLAAYSTVLREPTTGPRAVSRVPSPRTEAERDDLRAAIAGDAAAAFRVFARAAPIAPAALAQAPESAAGAPPDRLALEYVAADGGRRVVSLARDGARWHVDRFPL